MTPFLKKLLRVFRIKLLAPLLGVVCLGVALLIIVPAHASPSSPAFQVTGSGCSPANTGLKVCINVKDDQIVSDITITKGGTLVGICPDTVELELPGDNGLVALPKLNEQGGCRHFGGPAADLQKGKFVAQVSACFGGSETDCTGAASTSMTVS